MAVGKPPVGKWILFVAWGSLVTALSSLPGNRIAPLPFLEADKVAHAALFTVGAFVFITALGLTLPWSRFTLFFATLVFMVFFGALDEFHQLYTPGRSGADPWDLTADAIGSAIGATIGLLLNGQRNRKASLASADNNRAA